MVDYRRSSLKLCFIDLCWDGQSFCVKNGKDYILSDESMVIVDFDDIQQITFLTCAVAYAKTYEVDLLTIQLKGRNPKAPTAEALIKKRHF